MSVYLIPTKVVGVTFKNEDGTSRQDLIKKMSEDDNLMIEHQPDNPYDENAHVIKCNGAILGHISKEIAKELIEKQKHGEKIMGITEYKITGQDKNTLGVNIMIQMERENNG